MFMVLLGAGPAATPPDKARAEVDEMCRKLLANPIIEDYTFTVDEA
jgi:phosphoribosylformylglycinamidine synthase PurS subunit